MRVMRRRYAEGAKNLDVLRRVGKMILAPNDMGDLHFDVVDHVNEMKDPGAVRPANRHVRMRAGVGKIEIDLAADEIVDHNVFARRPETQGTLIFENVTAILEFL